MPLQEALSLVGLLLVLVLVLVGSYLVTRWAGTGLSGRFRPLSGGGSLRILDRLNVGRDQMLLVVQAAGRYFLVGSSPSGFSLLAELTAEEGEQWNSPPLDASGGGKPIDFQEWFRRMREKK